MKLNLDNLLKIQTNQLIILISAISALLAFKVLYGHHGWVNNDFPIYHEAARLISEGMWKESLKIYNWPMYPFSIASFHIIFKTDLLLSAQIISGLFFTLACISLLLILVESGADKPTIFFGGLLFLAAPQLAGKTLPMLVKDSGFWAFHLLSVLFLIKFIKKNTFKNGLLWQLFSIVAILFRVEGIAYALLLPLATVAVNTHGFRKKIINLLKIFTFYILLLITLITVIAIKQTKFETDSIRLTDLFSHIVSNTLTINKFIVEKTEAFKLAFDGGFEGLYPAGLLIAYLSLVILKLSKTASWLNLIFIFLTRKITNIRNNMDESVKPVFLTIVLIAFTIAILTVLNGQYLTGRYFSPLIFITIIFCSFSFRNLQVSKSKVAKVSFWLFIFINFSFFYKNVSSDESSNYQLLAAKWIKSTNIPVDRIYINSRRLNFYSGGNFIELNRPQGCEAIKSLVETQSLKQYEILAIYFRDEDEIACNNYLIKNAPSLKLEKKFYSENKGSYIQIFRNQTKTKDKE